MSVSVNWQQCNVSVLFVDLAQLLLLHQDIESELGMTREKLIRMALLLGSDYTEGVRCDSKPIQNCWCFIMNLFVDCHLDSVCVRVLNMTS